MGSREHSQACFGIHNPECVCPIDNRDARVRSVAPQMLAILRQVEWAGGDDGGVCPLCDGLQPLHQAYCEIHALLTEVDR